MSTGKAGWFGASIAKRVESDTRQGQSLTRSDDGFMIPVADIDLDPSQPRRQYDEASVMELAISLSRHTQIHPILVRQDGDRWRLICGHRRYLAAKHLGWKTIAAKVERRPLEEMAILEAQVAENIQRRDLNPIELAASHRRLQETLGVNNKELSSMLGISEGTICRSLRLLELDPETQAAIARGDLTPSAAIEAAPRKRPRKAPPKPKKTWSCKPLKGVTVSVQAKGSLAPSTIAEALTEALKALQGTKKAA